MKLIRIRILLWLIAWPASAQIKRQVVLTSECWTVTTPSAVRTTTQTSEPTAPTEANSFASPNDTVQPDQDMRELMLKILLANEDSIKVSLANSNGTTASLADPEQVESEVFSNSTGQSPTVTDILEGWTDLNMTEETVAVKENSSTVHSSPVSEGRSTGTVGEEQATAPMQFSTAQEEEHQTQPVQSVKPETRETDYGQQSETSSGVTTMQIEAESPIPIVPIITECPYSSTTAAMSFISRSTVGSVDLTVTVTMTAAAMAETERTTVTQTATQTVTVSTTEPETDTNSTLTESATQENVTATLHEEETTDTETTDSESINTSVADEEENSSTAETATEASTSHGASQEYTSEQNTTDMTMIEETSTDESTTLCQTKSGQTTSNEASCVDTTTKDQDEYSTAGHSTPPVHSQESTRMQQSAETDSAMSTDILNDSTEFIESTELPKTTESTSQTQTRKPTTPTSQRMPPPHSVSSQCRSSTTQKTRSVHKSSTPTTQPLTTAESTDESQIDESTVLENSSSQPFTTNMYTSFESEASSRVTTDTKTSTVTAIKVKESSTQADSEEATQDNNTTSSSQTSTKSTDQDATDPTVPTTIDQTSIDQSTLSTGLATTELQVQTTEQTSTSQVLVGRTTTFQTSVIQVSSDRTLTQPSTTTGPVTTQTAESHMSTGMDTGSGSSSSTTDDQVTSTETSNSIPVTTHQSSAVQAAIEQSSTPHLISSVSVAAESAVTSIVIRNPTTSSYQGPMETTTASTMSQSTEGLSQTSTTTEPLWPEALTKMTRNRVKGRQRIKTTPKKTVKSSQVTSRSTIMSTTDPFTTIVADTEQQRLTTGQEFPAPAMTDGTSNSGTIAGNRSDASSSTSTTILSSALHTTTPLDNIEATPRAEETTSSSSIFSSRSSSSSSRSSSSSSSTTSISTSVSATSARNIDDAATSPSASDARSTTSISTISSVSGPSTANTSPQETSKSSFLTTIGITHGAPDSTSSSSNTGSTDVVSTEINTSTTGLSTVASTSPIDTAVHQKPPSYRVRATQSTKNHQATEPSGMQESTTALSSTTSSKVQQRDTKNISTQTATTGAQSADSTSTTSVTTYTSGTTDRSSIQSSAISLALTPTTTPSQEDAKPEDPLSKTEQVIVSLLHYAGCIWGIACGALCLFFGTVTNARSRDRQLQACQEISYLAYHTILFVWREHTQNQAICTTAAILLHFLTLTYFAFLFLESIRNCCVVLLYLTCPKKDYRLIVLSLILGWSIPAFLVIISAGMYHQNYTSEFSCWLNYGHQVYQYTMYPVIILSILTVIISESAGSYKPCMARVPDEWKESHISCSVSRDSIFVILPLSLCSWLFGSTAVYYRNLPLHLLECKLNIALGIAVVASHVAENEKARAYVKRLGQKLKRKQEELMTGRRPKNLYPSGDAVNQGSPTLA